MVEFSDGKKKALGHFSKFEKKFKKNAPCFMSIFDECHKQSIQSHSISVANLKLLAENGHLQRLRTPRLHDKSFEIDFEKVGVKNASTFPGFCGDHDAALFRNIDTSNYRPVGEKITEYMFRALVHEGYAKMYANAMIDSYSIADVKKIAELERQDTVEAFELGYRDLFVQGNNVYKHLSSSIPQLSYLTILFDKILPFTFSGPINLEIKPNFGGQDPTNSTQVFEGIVASIIPFKEGSAFFLIFPKTQNANVMKLLKRFSKSKKYFSNEILQLGIESFDNIYFSTSWIDGLEDSLKNKLLTTFKNTLLGMDVLPNTTEFKVFLFGARPTSITSNSQTVKFWKSRLR